MKKVLKYVALILVIFVGIINLYGEEKKYSYINTRDLYLRPPGYEPEILNFLGDSIIITDESGKYVKNFWENIPAKKPWAIILDEAKKYTMEIKLQNMTKTEFKGKIRFRFYNGNGVWITVKEFENVRIPGHQINKFSFTIDASKISKDEYHSIIESIEDATKGDPLSENIWWNVLSIKDDAEYCEMGSQLKLHFFISQEVYDKYTKEENELDKQNEKRMIEEQKNDKK